MLQKIIYTLLLVFSFHILAAQKDIMLQTFYWDVPVDAENKKGLWWNNLHDKADEWKEFGITSLWIPAVSKGNWGIYDMGYGVYDHYDLGNYYQKGSVETRFGSRAGLEAMVAAMQDTTGGKPYIAVYADIILNHMFASDENAEPNSAVKQYVFDEAFRHGKQRVPYPSNEIRWVIPNAEAGEYLIRVKGYALDFSSHYHERGYELQVDYKGSGKDGPYTWAHELAKEGVVDFPESGHTLRAFIKQPEDYLTYRIVAPGGQDIAMRLTARRLDGNNWSWADQTNGYYPFEIIFQDRDIAPEKLQAHTNTRFFYPERTSDDEPHYEWNYSHFHPADQQGWLGGWGEEGEIIPNTKAYGNDLNTYDHVVQQRLKDWGRWMVEQVNFDGFRLDFVWGYQPEFAAAWINNLPLKKDNQRYIVSEYWGPAHRIHYWTNAVEEQGANTSVFDFPLKFTLTEMCNGDEGFDMRQLNHAGLIRNIEGYKLPASSVVTFLENHDTGKEHDKWITQDWHLGYAYLLTHEGTPCLFYPHLYGVTLQDMANHALTNPTPAELADEIRELVAFRSSYLDGRLEVLSHTGNPAPAENLHNVYVARRQGNGEKQGAVIVLNNSNESKGLWVDVNAPGFPDWSGKTLASYFNPTQTTTADEQGRVWVEAPPRGYRLFVLYDDLLKE